MVMRISDGLVGGAVVVRPPWNSFEGTVHGLVSRLAGVGSLPAAVVGEAVMKVCEREAIASTAMVDIGVSIPHARIAGVSGIQIALAVSPDSVYDVAVGAPISIVALVLSSPELMGEHLTYLAALSMLLQSGTNRERLRHAGSAEEILRVVREDEDGRA